MYRHSDGDLQSGPPTPPSLNPSFTCSSTSKTDMDRSADEAGEESQWWEMEIETLKANLKALNVQMFEQKKQWLAEKTVLEAKLQPGAADNGVSLSPASSTRSVSNQALSITSKGLIAHTQQQSPAFDRSSGSQELKLNNLPRSGGFRAGGNVGDDLVQLRSQVHSLNQTLSTLTQERDAAREELGVLRSQAQRWNVERAALQREVDVMRQTSARRMSESNHELSQALAVAEEEKAALQSELSLIQQSLKTHVLVPKQQMAQLTSGGGIAAAAAAAAAVTSGNMRSVAPSPRTTTPSMGGVDPAVTIAKLNAEITRLQADLYIIKDECVPVPKAEFAQLKAVHSDKASVEQEVRALKQEVTDMQRLNQLLREEMELIKEEHVAITMQEYDQLRRAASEKQALELKMEAQAKYYAQVPKEELAEMQAARRQVASLETRLASVSAVTTLAQDDPNKALQQTMAESADLRVKLLESEALCTELRKEVSQSEGRAVLINELKEKLQIADTNLAAAQQEKVRVQLRIRALEDERDAAKQSMKAALDESSRTLVDLAGLRDKCSALSQELATLARERGELDARLSEARAEREQVTNDLVEAKVELARLREMEIVYKKNVVKTAHKLADLQGFS